MQRVGGDELSLQSCRARRTSSSSFSTIDRIHAVQKVCEGLQECRAWYLLICLLYPQSDGRSGAVAASRRRFHTTDLIHSATKLIEVSREYKLSLCFTFTNLRNAFKSVGMKAVIEALATQDVSIKQGRVFEQLCSRLPKPRYSTTTSSQT